MTGVPVRGGRRAAIGICIVVMALGLCALTISSGMARALARPNASMALGFAPYDGIAAARRADAAVRQIPTGGDPEQAEQFARRALMRDPTRADALRVLGFVAEVRGDAARAEQMVRGAASLSRRDLPTQLWLIENRVTAGDVRGALVHYDIALRTSRSSWDMMTPILLAAWSDPELAPAIRDMLLARPPYLSHMLTLGSGQPAIASEVGQTLIALRRAGLPAPPREGAKVIETLIGSGDWAGASRLYTVMAGQSLAAPPNLLGDLNDANRYPPFDWRLSEQGGIAPLDGDALGLSFGVTSAGTFADRSVALAPGRHRLDVVIDAETVENDWALSWTARCERAEGAVLGRANANARAGTEQRLTSDITVPASGCRFVNISLAAAGEGGEARGIVTAMRLGR